MLKYVLVFLLLTSPASAFGHRTAPPQCPDSTPSYATSAGYTVCTFYATFPDLSRIDLLNTGGPSAIYDWFVQDQYNEGPPNAFGNIITAASWSGGLETITTNTAHGLGVGATVKIQDAVPAAINGTYTTQSGTTGSTLVVSIASNPGAYTASSGTALSSNGAGVLIPNINSNGTLEIVQPGRNSGNNNNAGLYSYYQPYAPVWPTTASMSAHGRLFYNGFLVRYTFAIPSSQITGNSSEFPALWMINWANNGGYAFCENDTVEMRFTGTAATGWTGRFHDNYNPVFPDENDDTLLQPSNTQLGSPTWDGAHYYTTDVLWIPTFKGGGTGSFTEYFNGTIINNGSYNFVQQYSNGSAPSPAFSPSSFASQMLQCDRGGFELILNAGWADAANSVPWQTYVKSIQVFQALPSDMRVN